MIPEHAIMTGSIVVASLVITSLAYFSKSMKPVLLGAILCIISALASYRGLNFFYGNPKVMRSLDYKDATILSFYPSNDREMLYMWIIPPGGEKPISYKLKFDKKLFEQLQKMRGTFKGTPFKGSIVVEQTTSPFGLDVKVKFIETLNSLPKKGGKKR